MIQTRNATHSYCTRSVELVEACCASKRSCAQSSYALLLRPDLSRARRTGKPHAAEPGAGVVCGDTACIQGETPQFSTNKNTYSAGGLGVFNSSGYSFSYDMIIVCFLNVTMILNKIQIETPQGILSPTIHTYELQCTYETRV